MENKINVLSEVINMKRASFTEKFDEVEFKFPSMYLSVDNSYNSVQIKVCENIERWSEEIVTVRMDMDRFGVKDKASYDFSYGSGGWKEGEIEKQLEMSAEAWRAAREVISILKTNETFFVETLNNLNTLRWECNKLYEIKRAEEIKASKITKEEELKEVTKNLTCIKSIEHIKSLFEYDYGTVIKIINNGDVINIQKFSVEINKNVKETYKFGKCRISKRALTEILEVGNVYMIPEKLNISCRNSVFYKNYSTVEEIKEVLK
jgi:hypothetical protein